MPSQSTPFSTPPLSSPELGAFHSRLEQGLVRLSHLVEEEAAETSPETESPQEPETKSSPRDVWATAMLPPPPERRAFPRRESNCRVAVCRLENKDWSLSPHQIEWRLHATSLKGTLSDLSLKGAAIILPQPLSVGENVVLRLFCPRRDRHLDQHATVVGLADEPSGECKVMCHFEKRLSLDQISLFSRFLNDTEWI